MDVPLTDVSKELWRARERAWKAERRAAGERV